jgi:RsmE family RNA methyltransferase
VSVKVFSKTIDVQVISGPEGGLTEIEKELLQTMGARVCALTPTILRAWAAVSVGAGFLRTWFYSKTMHG